MSILDFGPIGRVRRNHGIEHATIHILTRLAPHTTMAGRSNSHGFFLYGDVPTDVVRAATEEAIARIGAGEAQLVVHPNCGTNLVTVAALTSTSTLLATSGRGRHWFDRVPAGLLAALVAVFVGQIVGPLLQQYVTTSAQLDELSVEVVDLTRRQVGGRVWHWVGLQHTSATLAR